MKYYKLLQHDESLKHEEVIAVATNSNLNDVMNILQQGIAYSRVEITEEEYRNILNQFASPSEDINI